MWVFFYSFEVCLTLRNESHQKDDLIHLSLVFRTIMVQLLKHREVSFSRVSNPVKDSLKETASNPGFMQIRKFEQGKDV